MANSPSETWENGRKVARAMETNRWKVLPDGTPVEPANTDDTADAKAITAEDAENKSVKSRATAKK